MINKYFLAVILLSLLDNTLTHYQFFILKKRGYFNQRFERNPIARLLLKNPSPLSLITLFIYALILLWVIFYFSPINEFYYGMMVGIFIFVNYYHYGNISIFRGNWDNKPYWKSLHYRKL